MCCLMVDVCKSSSSYNEYVVAAGMLPASFACGIRQGQKAATIGCYPSVLVLKSETICYCPSVLLVSPPQPATFVELHRSS
jgi:hypothetical protein